MASAANPDRALGSAILAALIATLLALTALPSAAAAATCADYPNQAAAQQAGETRDADGDGVYCVISSR
jgi:hypothetical protein